MRNMPKLILLAMRALLKTIPYIKYCLLYSPLSILSLGNISPALLLRISEGPSGYQSAGMYLSNMAIDIIIISNNKINTRVSDHLGYINDIKQKFFTNLSISDTVLNIYEYETLTSTDGLSLNYDSAGTDGQTTVSIFRIKVNFLLILTLSS